MKLAEILDKERLRQDLQQSSVIHLMKEGTFYHAYEWSAWLCFRYVAQLKATRRLFANSISESMVFVGFPVNSLPKYTPEGANIVESDDGGLDMILPLSVFQPETTLDNLHSDFENWKQSVPLTEKSKNKVKEEKYGVSAAERPARLTDVMREIVSYPLEQHSPMECMMFVAEMKQKLVNII